MRKSDIICLLDSTFGADERIRESLPVRYLISIRDGRYHVYETGDLRHPDPDIFSIGSYPIGESSPKEFLEWFVND